MLSNTVNMTGISALSFDALDTSKPLALPSDPFLSGLHTQLNDSERCFVLGSVDEAAQLCSAVLSDLLSLHCHSVSGLPCMLCEPSHVCPAQCCCVAAMALYIQCLHEIYRYGTAASAVSALQSAVRTYYDSTQRLPFELFRLW